MEVLLYLLIFLNIPLSIITKKILLFIIVEIFLFLTIFTRAEKKDRLIDTLKIFIVLLTLQNVLIGIGGAITERVWGTVDTDIRLLTQIPTLFAVLLLLYLIFKKKFTYKRYDFIAIIFFFIIGVSFLLTKVNFLSKISYARNYIFFYIVFMVGRSIIVDKEKIKELAKFYIYVALFVISFGVIGEVFFSKEIWEEIFGVKYAFQAKGLNLNGELPSMWRTLILGFDVPRMVSTYMEPVNLSYFMASAAIISIFFKWTNNKKIRIITGVILIVGQILTFGKGGVLLLLSTIGSILIYMILTMLFKERINISMKFNIIKLLVVIGIVIIGIIYYYFIGDSAAPHFWGIINGFNKIIENPLGYGLGSGGNFANIFGVVGHQEWLESGSESALISIGYQLGILGMIFFIVIFEIISRELFKVYKKTNEKASLGLSFAVFLVVLVSIFQENTLSPQCISFIMLFAGAYSSLNIVEMPKIALVGSSGGHLTQLYLLKKTWSNYDRFWVTFDKEDSRSLLKNEKKYWCYYPTNRNIKNLIKNTFLAIKILILERPDIIISSGAAVAIPFFYLGKIFGAKLIYIEVYDRIDLPTITGKIVYPITDKFLLQWNEQKNFYPKGEVIGGII